MYGEQKARALLSASDPARGAVVPKSRVPVEALIARAEAGSLDVGFPPAVRRARPVRRLVLAGAAAAVAVTAVAGATVALRPVSESDRTAGGDRVTSSAITDAPTGDAVVLPMVYQVKANPPPAGDDLRKFAKRITAAAYDAHSGKYFYCRTKTWGDPTMASPDGRFVLGYAHEDETWTTADGSGSQKTKMLAPEYPDEASREYWKKQFAGSGAGSPSVPSATPAPDIGKVPVAPHGLKPLPADRAGLSQMLQVAHGPVAVTKMVAMVYSRYAVTRESRAMILEVLADVPGFLWRGEVTDRAGRAGVAITANRDGREASLVFDAKTGALLANEAVSTTRARPEVTTYQLFLGYDRVDRVG